MVYTIRNNISGNIDSGIITSEPFNGGSGSGIDNMFSVRGIRNGETEERHQVKESLGFLFNHLAT